MPDDLRGELGGCFHPAAGPCNSDGPDGCCTKCEAMAESGPMGEDVQEVAAHDAVLRSALMLARRQGWDDDAALRLAVIALSGSRLRLLNDLAKAHREQRPGVLVH